MKESAIVSRVMKRLTADGYFVIKIHGGPYQIAGLPDLLAIRHGRAMWVEVKRPGEKTTLIQDMMIKKLREHGCTVLVAYGVEELEETLREE